MGRREIGLRKRGDVWHIDKCVKGYGRLRESTGTGNRDEAERYMTHRLEEIHRAKYYGVRPTRTFAKAAQRYLDENQHLRAINRSAYALKALLPHIGSLPVEQVHDGTLTEFKKARLAAGMAAGTVNKELSVVRRILNLAARVWRDENGLTWLGTAPLIQFIPGRARQPYQLDWDEQDRLFRELPGYLQRMALFAVNTGLREQEVCKLRWDWEVKIPDREASVFIIPGYAHKNGLERIVVLNRVAGGVIDGQRDQHREWVFPLAGKPVHRMLNTAWKSARVRAGLPNVRVHDLKHTFGHRLRAAGVSLEDRQDLLGHKSDRITRHYSAPDISRLIEAVDKITVRQVTTVLRLVSQNSHTDGHKPTHLGREAVTG